MANYSRWDDVKKGRRPTSAEARTGVEQDLALGQLIYDLRTAAGLSQRELAERMGTTESVISRMEEGGGARNSLAGHALPVLVSGSPWASPYKRHPRPAGNVCKCAIPVA